MRQPFGRDVPWWGVASSVAAPLLLVTGWTIAATVQQHRYDPIKQTVSVLAAHGSTDRWIMTLAFLLVGVCDISSGLALRPAQALGRVILVIGGVGGVMVGANPETLKVGTTAGHVFFAGLGFIALSLWPAAAAYRSRAAVGRPVPWALRWRAGIAASAVTTALFAWFLVELVTGGALLGLSERALGEMQALWPLVVVVSARLCAMNLASRVTALDSDQRAARY